MKLSYILGFYLLMGLASLYFSFVLSDYFILSFLFSIAGILRVFQNFRKFEISDDGILVSRIFNISKHYYTYDSIVEWEYVNVLYGIGSKRIKLKDIRRGVTLFDWKSEEAIYDLLNILRKKIPNREVIQKTI
jgi:hypothetical protein